VSIIGSYTWFVKTLKTILATFWKYGEFMIKIVLLVSAIAAGPIAVLWTRSMDTGVQTVVTLVVLISVIALVAIPYWSYADPEVRSALPNLIRKTFKHSSILHFIMLFFLLGVALAVPVVPLAVIWTRPVSPGMKAAVTVVIVLIVFAALITLGFWKLFAPLRQTFSDTSSDSTRSSRSTHPSRR